MLPDIRSVETTVRISKSTVDHSVPRASGDYLFGTKTSPVLGCGYFDPAKRHTSRNIGLVAALIVSNLVRMVR